MNDSRRCWNEPCQREVKPDAWICTNPACLKPLKIPGHEDLDIVGGCGIGQFGTTYRVRNRRTGEERAVKMFHPHAEISDPASMKELHTILDVPEHANLVKYDKFMSNQKFLVMEYVPGGNLYDRVRRDPGQVRKHYRELVKGIAAGLRALHLRTPPIVHRDLKPQNILIDDREGEWVAKIADFGLSKVCSGGAVPKSKVGSLEVMAPEVLASLPDEAYDALVDLWAVGVNLFFIWTGEFPFASESPSVTRKRIAATDYPDPASVDPANPIPGTVRTLIEKLLTLPEERCRLMGSSQQLLEAVTESAAPQGVRPEAYPLETYALQIQRLYGDINAGEHPSLLLYRASDDLPSLVNALFENRPADYERELKSAAPKILAWLLAILDVAGLPLFPVVYSKYPDACPRCGEKPCSRQHTMTSADVEARLITEIIANGGRLATPPVGWPGTGTFEGLASFFRTVYPNSSLEKVMIVAKLYSECSEASKKFLKLAAKGAEPERALWGDFGAILELADVFAWFFALYNSITWEIGEFEAAFWSRYRACPKCQRLPCNGCIRHDLRREEVEFRTRLHRRAPDNPR